MILTGVALLSVQNVCFSQSNVQITGGLGLFELLNAGIKLGPKQFQTGVTIGTIPFTKDEKIFSVCGDLYFHFGDSAKYTSTKPWYVKTGVTYFRDATTTIDDKFTFLNLRFGRDLNISSKVGIDVEIGALIQLHHKRTPPDAFLLFDIEMPIWPAVGVSIFFRL